MLYQERNSIGQNYYECIKYVDFQFVLHMHKHPELIHVTEGTVILDSDNGTEQINAGQYALILSNRMHAYQSPGHSVVYVWIFSEDYIPDFARDVRGKRPDRTCFNCRPAVHDFVASELLVTDRIPDRYTIKSALYAVAGEYRRQISFRPETNADEELIHKILRYVNEHYTEHISLAEIAHILGYERHYLSRYFHSRINMHFSRFVNWYRIDAADDLLQHTDLPMTEVAMQSGFQSIRNFNRVYADLTGYSPRQAIKNSKI